MTTTQFSANKTPFSISDILTDLKANSLREDNKSVESDSMMRFHNQNQESSGVKQMLYGLASSGRESEGLAYSDMASAMRKRMGDKHASGGSFVRRRGSLECFLIDNKNQNQSFADRRDSYFGEQQAATKPLDMRRSVGSISDNYDSGEQLQSFCVLKSLVPGDAITLSLLFSFEKRKEKQTKLLTVSHAFNCLPSSQTVNQQTYTTAQLQRP